MSYLAYLADEEARNERIIDGYSGFQNRNHADSNGYYYFEVYSRDRKWFWSATNHYGEHVGSTHGPFLSSKDAYYDGVKQCE